MMHAHAPLLQTDCRNPPVIKHPSSYPNLLPVKASLTRISETHVTGTRSPLLAVLLRSTVVTLLPPPLILVTSGVPSWLTDTLAGLA